MPFSIRLYQRFPVYCFVTYHAGLFQGQGTVRNLSRTEVGEGYSRSAKLSWPGEMERSNL